MLRPPTWNRRKEICYGTTARVNPTRTSMRRMAKVIAILGPAAAYYCWIVERLGSRDWTRFKISDAAEALNTHESTIDRWNRAMVKAGFIAIQNRKWKGQQTYSTYVCQPINDIIDDQGTAPEPRRKGAPRPGRKGAPTKRAEKKRDCYALPSSPSRGEHLRSSPCEAGRSEPAVEPEAPPSLSPRGPSGRLAEEAIPLPWRPTVQAILATLPPCLSSSTPAQLWQDITKLLHTELWTPDGLLDYWNRTLAPIISHPSWFPNRHHRFGPGWVLLHHAAVAALRYGGEQPPRIRPGDTVRITNQYAPWNGRLAIVTRVMDKSCSVHVQGYERPFIEPLANVEPAEPEPTQQN